MCATPLSGDFMERHEDKIKYLVSVESSVSFIAQARTAARCLLKSVSPPKYRVIKDDQIKWAIYFCYNASGSLLPQNEFMINALKQDGFGVSVVLACASSEAIDDRFLKLSDVLIWKGMHGFDISALKIGLSHIQETRGEVDALWINDSVFGPFSSISTFIESCGGDFDVLGLTLAYSVRPHFQSYCFFIKKLNKPLIKSLFGAAFHTTLNDHLSNVLAFEACFAANLTARGFKVKCWAAPTQADFDLTMAFPFELVERGFPFIKRSLVGKFSTDFNQEAVGKFLRERKFHYRLE